MSAAIELASMVNPGRMLSDGVPYADLEQAQTQVAAGSVEWLDFWLDKARDYERVGEAALAGGHDITGGRWLWQASLSAHYAQFMWFHDPRRREAAQRRKVELYARAAPHLRPPAERVEILFEGVTIPGYLRLPLGAGPHPCVVVMGGLESTKEESHLFENTCLERGLATFAFDGPGQGEVFFQVKLGADFERYTSAVVDYLVSRPELDAGRLGVLGRSLGGHYAPKSAAHDRRIRACVAWGACFDLEDLDRMPERTRDGFVYVTGLESREKAFEHLRRSIDLSAAAVGIRCPLYVLHGRHDMIFSMAQVGKFREQLTNAPLEVVVEEEGDHCCHNMGHLVRPRMADWLADRLT